MITEDSGFTLIELIVVIFLIALISFIAFPRFGNSLSEYNFRAGVNNLTGFIRNIRSKAAITRKEFHLHFDIDKNEYWVTQLREQEQEQKQEQEWEQEQEQEQKHNTDNVFSPGKKKLNDHLELMDITVPELGTVASGEVSIRFFPTGYVDRSIIHLKNYYNHESVYSLFIKPLTGKVAIKEGYAE